MSTPDLMTEGLSLMMYGMGFVFLFLTALVVTTTLMSRIVARFFPDPVPAALPGRPRSANKPAGDSELIAAITAAVRMHRKKRP